MFGEIQYFTDSSKFPNIFEYSTILLIADDYSTLFLLNPICVSEDVFLIANAN